MERVGVVILPEEMIVKLKKNILPQWKACFLSVLIFGLITHMYKITNWLPNWDSLVFRHDAQNMLSIGRWFLPVASAPSSFYDLPWLTGFLAIVLHGLGAVCICKMFGVKKKVTAVLIGAVVVSFPTVTSVLLYNYVADAYALSFLLACVAALLLTREKTNYVMATICIALSVGIYQAYITVTIMLLLCYLIMKALRNDANIKTLFFKALKFLLCGICGISLYYGVLLILLKVTGTELLDYQGVSSAATLSGLDLWSSLYIAKESFANYFFDFSNGIQVFGVINVVIFLLTVVLYIIQAIRNKLSIGNLFVVCVCTILLPIGASVLSFINRSVDYHNIMKMGFVVFYLFLILQYEENDIENKKMDAVRVWAILIATLCLLSYHMVVANVSYHKLNMAYEKSYGTLIRIADRIEQTQGAKECNRILTIGALTDSEAYSANIYPDMTGTTDGFILRADDEMVGQSVLCSALNDYCGTDYTFVLGKEKEQLLKKINVDDLGDWPEKSSIFIIDQVIVIKLSN